MLTTGERRAYDNRARDAVVAVSVAVVLNDEGDMFIFSSELGV